MADTKSAVSFIATKAKSRFLFRQGIWILAAGLGLSWSLFLVDRFVHASPSADAYILPILTLVALTSILSGAFGMVGGMLLIGSLVLLLDLTTAMMLATVVLVSTNVWRLLMWIRDVRWDIVGLNVVGALLAFGLLQIAGYRPTRAVVLLVIGAPPLVMHFMPRSHWPSIDTRTGQLACGFVVGLSQIMGAASAALSDLFFQKSSLTRTEIVALRAASIVPLQILRGGFFALLGIEASGGLQIAVPIWLFAVAVVVAIGGTIMGGAFLKRSFTDATFRVWSWRLSIGVSLVFIFQGIWLISR